MTLFSVDMILYEPAAVVDGRLIHQITQIVWIRKMGGAMLATTRGKSVLLQQNQFDIERMFCTTTVLSGSSHLPRGSRRGHQHRFIHQKAHLRSGRR